METFVKRFGWTVGALVIGLTGLVHARTVANIVEATWLTGSSKGVMTVPAAPKAASNQGRKSEFVQARNVFDSTATQDDLPNPDLTAGKPDIDPSLVPDSDLSLVLAGAIYSPDPRWSLAIIEDGSPSKTKIVQVGNMIKPDAELVAIWAEEAWIKRSDGRIERIKNKHDKAASKKSASSYKSGTSSTTSSKKSSATSDAEKFKKGIIRKDSNTYQITRGLIEEQLADLNKLGTQARIIPHYKDGKANGFKLVGIRPGSLYSHIGIRSGDVIRGVNGSAIDSPTKALQAFEKFKNESEIDLEITRRGQKKVIHYKITD